MSSGRRFNIAFQLGANISASMRAAFDKVNKNLSDTAKNARHANSQANILGKSFGSLKSAAAGLGVALGGAFAVSKITSFGKSMIETAAELSAVREQYEQVMGDMTNTTDKYLSQMGLKWNKHPNELESTMMQYYAILKGKGVEEKKAYELAQQYLERSVDANMFANESMSDTTARFMAMIKGEYSSVDTAMVNMNVTMLNNKAIETYKKKWDKLTVAEQETLKMQEALRQHTASGVFGQGEREAESYANNVAMVKNTWEQLKGAFGTPLMVVANKQLQKLVSYMQRVNPEEVMNKLSRFKDKVATIGTTISSKLQPVISTIRTFVDTAVSSIKNVLSGNSGNILSAAEKWMDYGKNIFNGIVTIVQSILPIIKPILINAVEFIGSIIKQVVNFWNNDGAQLIQAVKNIFTAVNKIIQYIAPVATFILNSIWNNVKGVIQGALNIILGAVKIFSSLFTGNWSGLWEATKQTLKGTVQLLWNLWNLMFVGKIAKGFGTLILTVKEFFKSFGKNIATNIQLYYHLFIDGFLKIGAGIVRSISNAFSGIFNVAKNRITQLINVFQTARTFGTNIFMSLVSSISNLFSNTFGAVGNIIGSILSNSLSRIGNFIAGVQTFFSGLASTISGIFANIQIALLTPFNTLKTLVSTVVSSISTLITGLFTGLQATGKSAINVLIAGANAMINGINKLNVTVPDWVPGIGGESIGFSIANIPMLAKGGITTGPTLAMIGEGAEQEAVLPLSKLNALLNPSSNVSNSSQQFVYSPVYHVTGSATKEDVKETSQQGFNDFKRWISEVKNDNQRLTFNTKG